MSEELNTTEVKKPAAKKKLTAKERKQAAREQEELRKSTLELILEQEHIHRDADSPFEVTVKLQGDYGRVRIMDLPFGSVVNKPDFGKDELRQNAYRFKAHFVECIEDPSGRWPQKSDSLDTWTEFLKSLPCSVTDRVQEAINVLGFEPEEGGEGNSSPRSSPDS